MYAIDYETICREKAAKLQKSVAHVVSHGSKGECPKCGQIGIYDLKGVGLTAASIFYSTHHGQWRCMLCGLDPTCY
jgi:hypothetical protein